LGGAAAPLSEKKICRGHGVWRPGRSFLRAQKLTFSSGRPFPAPAGPFRCPAESSP
jgi:hypothetical protein